MTPAPRIAWFTALLLCSGFFWSCASHSQPSPVLAPVACGYTVQRTTGNFAWSTVGQRSSGWRPLGQSDWRQVYVGRWHLTIWVDSVQELVPYKGGVRSAMHPVLQPCSASGTLVILDSVQPGSPEGSTVLARLEMDWAHLFGGPIMWFGRVGLRRSNDRVLLGLSPGCFDCGVTAVLEPGRDSIVGSWAEMAYVGATRAGRVELRRLALP